MRAFLALPVTAPALEAGTALVGRLRAALPEVRWARPEGLHLTLHFWPALGEADIPRLLDAARRPLAVVPPFDLELAGLGAFPRDGDERVLWLGVRRGEPETAAIQAAVERELEAAGFPVEARTFHPHVTLGRPRTHLAAAARRRWRSFAEEAALPPSAVHEMRLYRSHMGPGGSRYEVLERLPLLGTPPSASP
jgi:2'-5' RNA ligase